MLPWRAGVDDPALTHFGLQRHELLIGASACRSIDNSDLIGLQFGMKQFDQIGAADGVDQHRAMFDRPPLSVHAVAMATDLQANHARAKRLEQHLGVGRVVAQVRDDQRIVVVTAIDRRQRARARTAIKSLRQLFELSDAEQPRLEGLFPPTTAVERSRLRPTSWAMMSGLKQGQVLASSRLNVIEYSSGLSCWNGFAMGTAGS